MYASIFRGSTGMFFFLREMQHRAALPRCKRSGFSLTQRGFRLFHNGVLQLQHLGGSDEVSRIRGVDRARAVDRRVRWRLRAITPIKQLERGQGQAVTYTTSKAPMSVCPGVDCTGA